VNSLERIGAAVAFQKPDRVPVIAQVFGHAGTLAGVPLDEYVRDGEKLAHCQLEALARYGYDAVFSVMGAGVETEAAGSTLNYRRNQYPAVDGYALQEDSDVGALAVPDPEHAGRMPEMLKALRILRGELGDEVLVVGCIVGPFTLAVQLLGIEKALFTAIDDFARLEQVMDYATEVIIRFGEAQLRAGAHLPMVFDPAASPAVIPHFSTNSCTAG
jgi:uroporphyrinogen decarboxylase